LVNKYQSETKDTIKSEIYERKKTTQKIKNAVEGHSSRLEQMEGRIPNSK
jgi:hypothetical protein